MPLASEDGTFNLKRQQRNKLIISSQTDYKINFSYEKNNFSYVICFAEHPRLFAD